MMCVEPWLVCAESGSASESGSESGSEEEEEEGITNVMEDAQKLSDIVGAAGMSSDAMSKAKQSRSEKKARKAMMKLGLKSFPGLLGFPEWTCFDIFSH